MPVYQSKKAGLGRQEVRVTAPENAAVFAVKCVLPEASEKNETVWVCAPDDFCLINAATGTGLIPRLSNGIWKTKRDKIERAELYCVANSLISRGMQESYAIRLPYERGTEADSAQEGLEYTFSMEVGDPAALCQLCRGLDTISLRSNAEDGTASVESVMLDAIRGSGRIPLPSSEDARDAYQRVADSFRELMDNVGLAVKDCTVIPWKTLEK